MTASTQSSLPAHDVAIDELMKAEAITGNVMPLLTYIGRVLDSSPNVGKQWHNVAIDELMKAEAITGNVMPLLT